MSGIDGLDAFQHLTEWLRALHARVKGEGVKRMGEAVQKVALAEYAQGKGPPGVKGAWPARKKDGAVALQRPAQELQFIGKAGAIRSTTADEPVLDHHRGKRPVYPGAGKSGQLSPTWREAGEKALSKFLDEQERKAPK